MTTTNYHTHCYLDDGTEALERYVDRAVDHRLAALGFSCHAPLPFPCDWVLSREAFTTYAAKVTELKRSRPGGPEIYFGLEVDYVRGVYGPASPEVASYGLDLTIGSVHFVSDPKNGKLYGIDGSPEEFAACLDEAFGGDARAMVREYYALVREMAATSTPDIVGHLDVIKKNNPDGRYFDEHERWYKEEIERTVEALAASGAIVETNTGGLARGRTDSVYPSPWIIRLCAQAGIPMNINSDAHSPDHLTHYFDEARHLLRENGYRECKVLLDGEWRMIEL